MRKPELVAAIAKEAEMTKSQAADVLNAVLDSIATSVSKDDDVTLIGFGTFTQRSRSERKGKNPRTGEEITIPASNTVAFKAGKTLKEAVA